MKPEETGLHYDRIALWWQQNHMDSTYGIAALERAIKFVENRSAALDIGCGSSGRFIEVLMKHGFSPTGVDISPEMISRKATASRCHLLRSRYLHLAIATKI